MPELDWKALAASVDNLVNDSFGVDIELIPWAPAMTDGKPDPYKVGGGEDGERDARDIRGCFVSKEMASKSFPAMASMDVVADMYVSIKSSDVGDLRKDDHVTVADPPDPWVAPLFAELSHITPGDTGRSLLHLIKIKSNDPVRSGRAMQLTPAPAQTATGEVEL